MFTFYQTYPAYKPVYQNRVKGVTENWFASGIHRALVLLQTLLKLSLSWWCSNHNVGHVQCAPMQWQCWACATFAPIPSLNIYAVCTNHVPMCSWAMSTNHKIWTYMQLWTNHKGRSCALLYLCSYSYVLVHMCTCVVVQESQWVGPISQRQCHLIWRRPSMLLCCVERQLAQCESCERQLLQCTMSEASTRWVSLTHN